MSAPADTSPAPQQDGAPRVHPAQQPRDTTNDLLVLNLRITEASGVKAPLVLCVPARPFGTAGLQLVHLAAYIGEVHRSGQDPTSAGAYEFMLQRTPWAGYPWQPIHDSRVTCQLDLLLGPSDDTGWPAVSLVVLESEDGLWGFSRKRHRPGASALLRLAFEEIDGDYSNLCSRAARTQDPEVVELRDRAADLVAEARELRKEAQKLTNSEGARRSRSALHTPVDPRPGTSAFLQLDPEPQRLETFTGRITEIDSRTGADGETATMFNLVHDQGRTSANGQELPTKLRCTIRGEAAQNAAELPVGRQVIVVGRLVQQIYMPKEQGLPRHLTGLDVHALGSDLLGPGLT